MAAISDESDSSKHKVYTMSLCVLLFAIIWQCCGASQSVRLFSEVDRKGFNIDFNDYQDNLTRMEFNDVSSSACVTGIWFLYEEPKFGPDGNGFVEFAWGDEHCFNLDPIVDNKVSSVKYAGNFHDWRQDMITLYTHHWFQGDELYDETDQKFMASGEILAKSAVVSGVSNWTIYENKNYTGSAWCLQPQDTTNASAPGFYTDLAKDGVKFVRSFRKGCDSDRIPKALQVTKKQQNNDHESNCC